MVGWPPVRSFRKNLASGSSSKLGNDSTTSNGVALKNQKCDDDVKTIEPKRQGGMFVKINMYGVPIGRKVDLSVHTSYEQLSFTVDKLFRGLLAGKFETFDSLLNMDTQDYSFDSLCSYFVSSKRLIIIYRRWKTNHWIIRWEWRIYSYIWRQWRRQDACRRCPMAVRIFSFSFFLNLIQLFALSKEEELDS